MSLLRHFSFRTNPFPESLSNSELFSIYYHNIFDYPLTFPELIKWTSKNAPLMDFRASCKNGFCFVEGREGLIYKRAIRERYSQGKIQIAKKVSRTISILPGIKMIGLTGSLAMENADKDDDIDLMIITKKGQLWSTRLMTYILLKLLNYKIRKPAHSRGKDRLCLNIWMDESDLVWGKKDRNFYTAHEILQIVPLIDKNGMYERFLTKNRWALDFWPNVKEIRNNNNTSYTKQRRLNYIETLCFKMQYYYMKPKITREVVTITRAIFHPNDLTRIVAKKIHLTNLSSKN